MAPGSSNNADPKNKGKKFKDVHHSNKAQMAERTVVKHRQGVDKASSGSSQQSEESQEHSAKKADKQPVTETAEVITAAEQKNARELDAMVSRMQQLNSALVKAVHPTNSKLQLSQGLCASD